jgi:hypothetical protein
MDNVTNCDSYINIPSSHINRSYGNNYIYKCIRFKWAGNLHVVGMNQKRLAIRILRQNERQKEHRKT